MNTARIPTLVLAVVYSGIGVLLVAIFGFMSVAAMLPTTGSSGVWVGMLRQTLAGLLVGLLFCAAGIGLARRRRWARWPSIGVSLAALVFLVLAVPNTLRMYELEYIPGGTGNATAFVDWRLYSLFAQNYEHRLYFFAASLLMAVLVSLRRDEA